MPAEPDDEIVILVDGPRASAARVRADVDAHRRGQGRTPHRRERREALKGRTVRLVIHRRPRRAPVTLRCRYFFASSSDRIGASVHVMSTRSPTFTFASASLSFTRVVYFQFCGPVKVIDGRFGSIAVIVAVMVR